MTLRLAAGLAATLALVAGILLLRPSTPPVPREVDIMSGLVNDFVVPMGDLIVTSRPSDCRTDGVTKAAVPAALFARFLQANRVDEAFDLTVFADRLRLGDAADEQDQSPRRLYAMSRAPVVSISRAGFRQDDALVCVEVFASQERAFFVLLSRGNRAWSVVRELTAWEAPEPENFSRSEIDDEPLFAPRPRRPVTD